MPYAPDSPILFLTLGSFNQRRGGTQTYSTQESIVASLPDPYNTLLLQGRVEALRWLLSEQSIQWQGQPLAKLETNKGIVYGPDFGGNDRRATYLDAIDRFQGRFFQTLGADGRRKLYHSQHHVLFLCGLYGLIAPLETIQHYDCPVDYGWEIFYIWDDRLTEVLLTYTHMYRIKRVFDLAATNVRRHLIDWSVVRSALAGGVLHAYGTRSAGENILADLGHLMRDYLLNAPVQELLSLKSDSRMESSGPTIVFRERPGVLPGEPREIAGTISMADDLDRKRRGIVQLLNRLDKRSLANHEGYAGRVKRLLDADKLAVNIANDMLLIGRLRNRMHYEGQQPTANELQDVRRAWNSIKRTYASKVVDIAEFAT